MENIIIIGILAVLVLVGIRSTAKHFKGEGGCCGGGTAPVKVEEKKLSQVIRTKTVIVDGMTCDHCKAWVEKSINEIDGVAAKVNLKKREVVVSMEKEISDEQIYRAIEKAGYRVVKEERR